MKCILCFPSCRKLNTLLVFWNKSNKNITNTWSQLIQINWKNLYLWTVSDINFHLCQQQSLWEVLNGHDCQILDVVALHVSVCTEDHTQVEENFLAGNANPKSRKTKRLGLLIPRKTQAVFDTT